MEQKQIDWTTFATCLAIILLVCLPLVMSPDVGGKIVLKSYAFIAAEFGFLYMLAGTVVMVLLAWLAFGRYGQVLPGAAGEEPEFSDYSWAAMLICAGVGGVLMSVSLLKQSRQDHLRP